ncbi:hypothetical protein HPB50_006337 [Hyalomma asiaticum]|uniref:Uncharacterized protein n=1 Tax=Hyalomma asiaticum TaxID=266040 RepID=A0ACB7RXL1_HYAAI|nr:hypothetical protein HPB50_006337 [Hyalomma asiaticum]
MATIGEAYYAYLFVFCARYVDEDALRYTLAAVFHLLLLFCLWSYAQTTFTPPPTVPSGFQFTKGERLELARCSCHPQLEHAALEDMASRRGVLTRFRNGAVGCCKPCGLVKPDRCHHCSRCVLKMDHHCPWFNNCVCFSTYKFFLLTLFYIALLAAYSMVSVTVYMLHKNPHRSLLHRSRHVTFLLVIGGSTTVMIGGFLCMHVSLVVRNRTTLESTRLPVFRDGDDSFDIGVRKNFLEVFGLKVALWLIPVFTSLGDGCHFPTRRHPNSGKPVEIASFRCTALADGLMVAADPKARGEPGLPNPSSAATTPKDGALSQTPLTATTERERGSSTPETATTTRVFHVYLGDGKGGDDVVAKSTGKPTSTTVDRHSALSDGASALSDGANFR